MKFPLSKKADSQDPFRGIISATEKWNELEGFDYRDTFGESMCAIKSKGVWKGLFSISISLVNMSDTVHDLIRKFCQLKHISIDI